MAHCNPRRLALLLLAAPALSMAQYESGATYQIAMNNTAFTQSMLMTSELARMGQRTYGANSAYNTPRSGYAPRSYGGSRPLPRSVSALTIANDPRISDQVWTEFIDGVRARSGERIADELEAVFRRRNVRTVFNDTAGPYGLHANDYGDVLAGYIVALWMMANQAPVPSMAQIQSVNGQVHGQLARTGVNATPRQLQTQAEQMMYEVVATVYIRQQAERAGDRRALEDMAEVARRNFLERGLDLQAMVLREGTGLVRR